MYTKNKGHWIESTLEKNFLIICWYNDILLYKNKGLKQTFAFDWHIGVF